MNKITISAAIRPDLWKTFRTVCSENDESASRRLQILIRQHVSKFNNPENEPKDNLVAKNPAE